MTDCNESESRIENNKDRIGVSVIIPVYNVESYLRECIDSVVNQNMKNLEIILVNDGSTDCSGDICREYGARYENVIVLEKENGGLSSARNAGFQMASGEYVYFLDSDDYISPMCLQSLYERADRDRLDILSFAAVGFCEGEEWQPEAYRKEHIYETGVSGKKLFAQLCQYGEYTSSVPQYLIRREAILSHQLTFAEGYFHEDEIYTFILLQSVERAGVLNQIFYHRRYRPGSITQSDYSFSRFEGYAYACSEMIDFYRRQQYTKEQRAAADKYILKTYKNAVMPEMELKSEERKKYRQSVVELQKKIRKIGCCHSLEGYMMGYFLTAYRYYMRIKKYVTPGKRNS